MIKANVQQTKTIRRGPYANSPMTHKARKKTIKNIPAKNEITPSILISSSRISF
jgi:hypothetical protein